MPRNASSSEPEESPSVPVNWKKTPFSVPESSSSEVVSLMVYSTFTSVEQSVPDQPARHTHS